MKRLVPDHPHILLADDHAAIRMGVRAMILGLWPDARVVEVSDGITFGRELSSRAWALVVVDQTMPGATGLEALAQAAAVPPVLVYTMHESREIVFAAKQAGAAGFVSKASDPAVLEEAVKAVAGGGTWFPPVFDASEVSFSEREREVLDLLLQGMGPKEVAARLDISASSVQTHITRLLSKLGLKSTRELFRWAATKGRL